MLLFKRTHAYQLDIPFNDAESKLKFIITRRFDDYSIDVIGGLGKDGSFSLTNKWGLANINWVENRPAYLTGALSKNEEATLVEIKIRPNIVFVVFFYLLMALLVIEVLSLETLLQVPSEIKIVGVLLFSLILLLVMFVCTNGLKRKFEQLMHIKRNQI